MNYAKEKRRKKKEKERVRIIFILFVSFRSFPSIRFHAISRLVSPIIPVENATYPASYCDPPPPPPCLPFDAII